MTETAVTVPPCPAAFAKPGAYVAGLAALLLALNELSMLSAGFLDSAGAAWTFNDLVGPQVWSNRGGWDAVFTPDQLEAWRRMFWVYLALDAAFILTYWRALTSAITGGLRWLVVGLVVVDVVETVCDAILMLRRCAGGGCLKGRFVDAVAVVSLVKWALVAILVGALFIAVIRYLPRVWQVCRAMFIQRFSLLAFLPIAVLSVVPGTPVTDMFDQLPDVERQWLDGPTGIWHATAAGLVHGLVLLPAIFLLGRIRADWATRRAAGNGLWPWFSQSSAGGVATARAQHLGLWLVGPSVLVVLAAYSELRDSGSVVWSRLVAFCAVPVFVLLASWLLRLRPPRLRRPGAVPPAYPTDVMAVGDIVTVASVSLAGLGLVRALTALAASDFAQGAGGEAVLPAVLTVAGAVLAVAAWPMGAWLLDEIASRGEADGGVLSWFGKLATPGVNRDGSLDVDGEPRTLVRTALLAVAVAGFIAISLYPRELAGAVGALALTIAALAFLVVIVGVAVTYVQERQPPALFRLRWATALLACLIVVCLVPGGLAGWVGEFRVVIAVAAVVAGAVSVVISYAPEPTPLRPAELPVAGVGPRATPVVPLFLLAALLANLVGSARDVHPVAQAGQTPIRPTMAQAFDAWLGQQRVCTSKVTMNGRELEVRPMLMIAAEGGGLRASYWTTAALDEIAAAGAGCGRTSTLFSGGASGGAFGLTLARFIDQPLDSVRSIAGSKALGAASASLFGGDVLASATGIRLESGTPHRDTARAWLDRAGLMETVWEDQVDLPDGTAYLPADPADATSGGGTVTGQLILTSTVVRTACRALLSQVDLGPSKTDCPGGSGPRSFDLFGAYGACLGNLPALTGGLLASRFPYVTPSGSVGQCGDREFVQLIDGGYSDNTGLGTITNLAPEWLPLVRAHNEKVLTGADGPIVVPVVVYLENGTGSDFGVSVEAGQDDPPDDPADQEPAELDWQLTPEILVPPVSALRARGHRIGAVTSLVKARGLMSAALCRTTVVGCASLRGQVRDWAPQRVFVVHQSQQPTVSAPLGWVLSEASQADMQVDLHEQLNKSCDELRVDPGCKAGFANLHGLVALLGG